MKAKNRCRRKNEAYLRELDDIIEKPTDVQILNSLYYFQVLVWET